MPRVYPEVDYDEVLSVTDLVFVYGSLKSDKHNHPVLTCSDGNIHSHSDYLYKTVENTVMISNSGAFPGIADMSAVTEEQRQHLSYPILPVVGEVYRVDSHAMRNLDYLEGYPSFYNRRLMSVLKMAEGDEKVDVWAYFQNNIIIGPDLSANAKIGPSGSFGGHNRCYVW
jgi:gamma-glutamylcyclotransferase (GGCT)/AIG2-like uncharacterized protein YtfP